MPSFRFTVPGQPISVNHAYEIVRYHGHATLRKIPGVESYQLVAKNEANKAKPRDFAPQGQVRMTYWIRSKRWVDASNCIKIVEDGVAAGLNLDDRVFLPCVAENSKGHTDPSIEVEVEYNQ